MSSGIQLIVGSSIAAICFIGTIYGGYLVHDALKRMSQVEEVSKEERTSLLSGRLEAEKEPLTENLIHIYVGTNVSSLSTKEEFEDKGTWLPQVKVSFKNGEVLLSANIIGSDGKTIAYVKDNEFKVNEKNASYFESNHDKYGLEVIDQYNVPVLQMEFLDQYTIKLAGLFFSNNDIRYATDYGYIGFTPDEYNVYADKIRILLEKQQRLFQYPSELHFGKRVPHFDEVQEKMYLRAKDEFSRLTKEELKKVTLHLVLRIRQFLYSHKLSPPSFISERKSEKIEDANDKTINKIKITMEMQELIAKRQEQYNVMFRPYTIAAHDELLSRLPNETDREEYSRHYERATSGYEYETVSNDLERLAQILE